MEKKKSEVNLIENLLIPLRLQGIMETGLRIPDDLETAALASSFEEGLKVMSMRKPHVIYRLSTQAPTLYAKAASYIKWLMLKTRKHSFSYDTRLEDIRRKFLTKVINENEISCPCNKSCVITHDIDTKMGLKRSLRLKEIETRYGVSSTWFIPSNQYAMDKWILKKLADGSEIASHDVKHDGRLILLGRECKMKRLRQSKEELEMIVGQRVVGFRAPFLQYDYGLMEAVRKAGYMYDSSAPTWEPVVHPTSLKPDGITLIDPLKMDDFVELPLSLPQDHIMIHYLRLSMKRTIELWFDLIQRTINSFDSTSMFLIHPDYEFASQEGLGFYKELIEKLIEEQFSLLNAKELAERVLNRSSSRHS